MFKLVDLFLITGIIPHPVSSYPFLAGRNNDQQTGDEHWVTMWTTMPQMERCRFQQCYCSANTPAFIAADEIRIRLSNAFSPNNLKVTHVTLGLPAGHQVGVGALATGSVRTVFFGGSPAVEIPNGGLAVSDPLKFPIAAQTALMIDIYLESGQQGFEITGHPGSRTTSYLALGDWCGVANFTDSSVQTTDHWYFISAVEARLSSESAGFVIVGDSITDGRESITNANNRWPDLLLQKMQKHRSTSHVAILNQAAGGNRILQDGLGPNVISRLDRDVLAQSGVRYMMIFEGVNDIGVTDSDPAAQAVIERSLVAAYKQIATRIHALGISVFGATITPFGSPEDSDYIQPYSSSEREGTRQRINHFIRESNIFDGVLDFDLVLRDPSAPSQLFARYDSGDHLHPNVAGYQALADHFPLEIFS